MDPRSGRIHLPGPSYAGVSRDFVSRQGLCTGCRHLLSAWPGWPIYTEWGDKYPGDLILPSHPLGFPSSWFMDEEGQLRYQDNDSGEAQSGDPYHCFYRDASELAYHECHLCSLIDAAIRLKTSHGYEYVQLGVLPYSGGLVWIYIQSRDRAGDDVGASLCLSRVSESDHTVKAALSGMTPSTGSQASIRLLKKRLESCRKERPPTQEPRWSPTRLLAVTREGNHSFSSRPKVCLVHSQTLEASPEYLTLSHRWGTGKSLKLLKENRNHFEQNIPWEQIPRTFQDAISLTDALGYSYIWIDSLCIVQDDAADWESEAVRMGDVYGNTILNIYANRAAGSDSGLYSHNRSVNTGIGFTVRTDWPYEMADNQWFCQLSYRDIYDERHSSRLHSELASRGWVVQEELLPTAVAYFGKDDIFWTCTHGASSEISCGSKHASFDDSWAGLPLERAITTRQNLKQVGTWDVAGKCEPETTMSRTNDHLEVWNMIIQRYNTSDLTFESDKTVAFSGLARSLGKAFKWPEKDYIAGLWKSTLIETMCWRAERLGRAVDAADRPGLYAAPSWSWMSTKGELVPDTFMYRSFEACPTLASLVDASATGPGGAFGKITSGRLMIKSYVWEFTAELNPRWTSQKQLLNIKLKCGHPLLSDRSGNGVHLDALPRTDDVPKNGDLRRDNSDRHDQVTSDSEEATQTVHFFFLARRMYASSLSVPFGPLHYRLHIDGLLLQRDASDRRGEHQRIGYGEFSLSDLAHGACTDHHLDPSCYLRKHEQSDGLRRAAQATINYRLDEKRREKLSESAILWEDLVRKMTGDVSEWKDAGGVLWPATDLACGEGDEGWDDTQYEVQIN